MAKKWSEVQAMPEYQTMPDHEKEAARAQYFDQVVAPQVPAEKLREVRATFDAQTGPARQNAARQTPEQMQAQIEDERVRMQRQMVDSMSPYEKFMAGAGRSVDQTWLGLKQVGGAVADAIPGVDLTGFRQRTQGGIDQSRRDDEELMGTGWGTAGNITGTVAQLVTPGAALKGTAAARYLLPTTIRGNALQGAALGTLQPTATGESRTENALVGTAAGGGGAAAMKGVAQGYAAGKNALMGSRRASSGVSAEVRDNGSLAAKKTDVTSVDREAVRAILAEANNPESLRVSAPSALTGVQRNLAEESRDAGIARLTQTLRGQPGFDWGARDSANNIARTDALEKLAGTDSAMAAAIEARSSAASGAFDKAMQSGPVDISRVVAMLDDAIDAERGNIATQPALREIRALLAKDVESAPGLVTTVPEDSINVINNARESLGYMLGGRYGGDNAKALAGSRALIGIRDALNKEVGEQVPAFTEFLDAFRNGSGDINRMEVGREILRRSTQNIETDSVGNRMLASKPLANAIRDLDGIAAKATGFDKAKAEKFMQPADIAMLRAMQDDAERKSFAMSQGNGGNSATNARGGVVDRIGRAALNAGAAVTPYGQQAKGFVQMLDDNGTQRMKERMAYLVANPGDFRRVLATLPPEGQKILARAVAQLAEAFPEKEAAQGGLASRVATTSGMNSAGSIGGAFGAATGIAGATQDQPFEVDIIGSAAGQPVTPEELERLRAQMRGRASAAGAY